MTRLVKLSLLIAAITVTLAACNKGPLLGLVTDTYVNQTDATQTLELTNQETLKGFIAGHAPNVDGLYSFSDQQKVTTGGFSKEGTTYLLRSKDGRKTKISMQQDGSLRDEAGNTWRHQERFRSFRPPEKILADRRAAKSS